MFFVDYVTIDSTTVVTRQIALSGMPIQGYAVDVIANGAQLPGVDLIASSYDGTFFLNWADPSYSLYNELALGDIVRVFYDSQGSLDRHINPTFVVEYFTIASEMQVTLSGIPVNGVAVDVIGGVAQFPGIDFYGEVFIDGNEDGTYLVRWDSPEYSLYNELSPGDSIRVTYDSTSFNIPSYVDGDIGQAYIFDDFGSVIQYS
jgi:hypothetical protein